MSEESAYNTSKVASEELVDSILRGTALNYVGRRACVCGSSAVARRGTKHVELAELARKKELAGDQERNHIHRATMNGSWLNDVPHRLNGTEFSREEFQYNFRLRYELMPQYIYATCYGCGNRFLINNAVS